jgi:peptidoglycan/xylan/chitin deacetylase (PgdA/CDA1 family)
METKVPLIPISILLYHQIGRHPKLGTNLSCFCDVDRFYSQMAYLKKSFYNVIGLKELYESLLGNQTPYRPSVVLTFDDADISFYDLVMPILQEFKFPSVLFAVSGVLGLKAKWIKRTSAKVSIMTAKQIRELNSLGVEVGSHSIEHFRLTHLNREQMINEIYDSKKSLEDVLDDEVYSFAYPHGDYDPRVIDIVKDSGYKCAVTCKPENIGVAPNLYELPRKYITYHDDLEQFVLKLNT